MSNIPLFSRSLALAFTIVSLSQYAAGAIAITGFTDAENDRFTNSTDFIADFDLSGVSSSSQWGTLISPNAVLTANHHRASGILQFFPDNDATSTPVLRTVIGGQRIATSDLYVAFLNANVPSSIKVYDFATEDLSTTPASGTNVPIGSAGSFQNQEVFMVGISPTASASAATDQAVGRNLVTGYAEDIPFGGGVVDALIMARDTLGDSDFLTHEAYVQGGDSGAPLFIKQGGDVVLLGVNSFQLTGTGTPSQYSGVNYTGNFDTEINAILTANAVPEPGTFAVLAAIGYFVAGHRRRRQHC